MSSLTSTSLPDTTRSKPLYTWFIEYKSGKRLEERAARQLSETERVDLFVGVRRLGWEPNDHLTQAVFRKTFSLEPADTETPILFRRVYNFVAPVTVAAYYLGVTDPVKSTCNVLVIQPGFVIQAPGRAVVFPGAIEVLKSMTESSQLETWLKSLSAL